MYIEKIHQLEMSTFQKSFHQCLNWLEPQSWLVLRLLLGSLIYSAQGLDQFCHKVCCSKRYFQVYWKAMGAFRQVLSMVTPEVTIKKNT